VNIIIELKFKVLFMKGNYTLNKCLSLFIFLFILTSSYSQRITNIEKRAIAYKNKGEYYSALELYKKLELKSSTRFISQLAYIYYELKDYDNALKYYSIYANRNTPYKDSINIMYAELLIINSQYYRAKNILEDYKKTNEKALRFYNSCDSSLTWMRTHNSYKVIPLNQVNTMYSDMSPTVYKKGIVFSSNREGVYIKAKSRVTDLPYYRLYYSIYDESWSTPAQLFSSTADYIHEGKSAFDNNFNDIYYTRTTYTEGSPNQRGMSIYKTEKDSVGWSIPTMLNFGESSYTNCHPHISADGNMFLFSSNMPGGFGGMDLYISIKTDSVWTKPINLGPQINTRENEIYPCIVNNNKIYFSSNGHVGMGGYDLYVTEFLNGSWVTPQNMYPPVNSSYDDYSITFKNGENSGFFSSNRVDGKGKEDIYMFIKR